MNLKLALPGIYSASTVQCIDRVVGAALRDAVCINAILLAGGSEGWVEIGRFGAAPPCELSIDLEARVRMAASYGDIIIVSNGECGFQKNRHYEIRHDPGASLLCACIRNPNSELCGVLLMGHPDFKSQLSAAQRYALQTHALELAALLNGTSATAPVAPQQLERLRLLESVVINAKDAVIITEAEPIDQPGPKIVYSNPAFEKTTGYSSEEVLGSTPRILQSEQTSRATLDRIRVALSRWEPIEVELINARKDGSPFWVELSIVPVADENGWFTHWISVQRDISERKEAERLAQDAHEAWKERVALESRLEERERISEELAYAAYHDELTSLHNRAYLMSYLERTFAEQGDRKRVTVLFIDLDGFKLVNDSLGHLAGDELLSTVAQRLQASLRAEDILARLGGDEFAIVLTGMDHVDVAQDLPRRIIERLSKPFALRGQDIFVSCSIGAVTADHRHTQPDDLLRDADVAMYSAKKQGRGRWTWFDSSMREVAVSQLLIQNTLRRAVIDHDFFIHYQPIYSGASLQLVGFEALVRWRHPHLGMVKPEVFISLAEDLGLIHELGGWVMKKAADDVQHWRSKYPGLNLLLNVNVSGKELTRPNYVADITRIIAESGLSADALQIEVTETVFFLQPEIVAKALSEIRSLGVRVGLDDFGTGYSSLSYIDQYPIDTVKIDKSFVSRMMHLARSKAIVESILTLGRSLDLDIVAEGVETKEQLDLLIAMSCPYLQGHFLSLPLSREDVEEMLERSEHKQ